MFDNVARIERLVSDQGKDLDRLVRDMMDIEESLLELIQTQRKLYRGIVEAARQMRDEGYFCTPVSHAPRRECASCKMSAALKDLERAGGLAS